MWEKVPPRMRKEFTFENFERAMDFVNRVAKVAESLNHHPDIHISYSKVIIETWTHSAGDITEKDRRLMEMIDELIE